jgi:hypothetical protein
MLLSRFPEEIIQQYNLNALTVDVWVYIEARKGMYGLKQGDYSPTNYYTLG